MAEKEIPEALSSLFEAVLSYQDTQDGLARVRTSAQSTFGDQWREKLPDILKDCPENLLKQVKTNIGRALTYEKAGAVWTEVSRMLDPKRRIDVKQVKARLPDMQKSLAIFGKAGQDLIARLQDKIAKTEADPSAGGSSASDNYGLTVDQLWNFEHFMRLKSYYDQTISRTSARCVHLGGLELSQYPYFGYILDLLDEILTFGFEIVTPPYARIIQERYKGGDAALKKLLMEFKAEFDSNAPPEMLEEEETMDEVRERLGTLADKNEVEGDIGPAPDGFEASDEQAASVSPQQARPVQGRQPVVKQPMAKSPQKMSVKAPAQVKVPVKRSVPAG